MPVSREIIVLVGLMGCGKTRVGGELAKLLKTPFVDSDREIEESAGMSVTEIFERFGEPEFRKGERKVLLRLLDEGPRVIASGGGAFIQPEIRSEVKQKAISVWLKADIKTLLERVSRTSHRPLLRDADPEKKLRDLMDTRYPVYAEADITVVTDRQAPHEMALRIKAEIEKLMKERAGR